MAQDRPEIYAGVFQLKLEASLHMVSSEKLLRTTVAYVKVFEIPKKVLFHAF